MSSLQEIKPRQIRALLLLLVLTPLIPTGLLLRFMFETVQQEREVARQTLADAYQDTLTIALHAVDKDLEKSSGSATKSHVETVVAEALTECFEPEVHVEILDPNHIATAGSNRVKGSPIVTAPAGNLLPGYQIRLFLANPSFVQAAVQEQIDNYTRIAIVTIAANLLIAFTAGWAFLRQIRQQELTSTSLATLAHELRTPVASMRLLLDTLREGRCPAPAEYLELLAHENERLSRLVDQFLTHSRLESKQPGQEPFQPQSLVPADLVAAAEDHFRHRLQSPDLVYQSELSPDLPNLSGDAASLICLLDNLLDNAWKYSGPKRQITLRVSASSNASSNFIAATSISIVFLEKAAPSPSGCPPKKRNLPNMETILIIEDDPVILRGLKDNFTFVGHRVLTASDGERGLELATHQPPDLIILDIMLPKINGYEICRLLRQQGSDIPIIILSARGQESEVVLGLNLGADAYVAKPFSIKELLARTEAILRRRREPAESLLSFGECLLDSASRRLTRRGEEIKLSPKEFELLLFLVRKPNHAFSRDEIFNKVWGYEHRVASRSIDRFITTLRQKIEPDPHQPSHLLTIREFGYKFVP